MAGYKLMMDGLYTCQTIDGLWNQVLDYPGTENWAETSGSAMFIYAFVIGVKKGWLEKDKYALAARNAWVALANEVDTEGNLHQINNWCYFFGDDELEAYIIESVRHQQSNVQEYDPESPMIVTGDLHGQAPLLWAAAAFLQ